MQKVNNLIVAPYFEDAAADEFCLELSKHISNEDYVLMIDDGSVRAPFERGLLTKNGIRGSVIHLIRNVGHQVAISVGIDYAVKHFNFNTLVTMDSDGEDRPEDIHKLDRILKESDSDVVVALRRSRKESVKFKIFYFFYKIFFRCLVGRTLRFGNFIAFTNIAAKRLSSSSETSLHLASAVLNSKLRIGRAELDRGNRYLGDSKMNFVALTLHGLRSIMVFSDQVLVRLTLLSIFVAAFVILAMFVATGMKISGAAIPGWYSTGGGILLILLFQAGFMALMMLLLSGKIKNTPASNLDIGRLISEVKSG